MDIAQIAAALRSVGLLSRGGFHPRPEDRVPPMPGGRAAGTVVLAGNAGPSMWEAFRSALTAATRSHPLNDWTRSVLQPVAEKFGARVLYPFEGPPYHPFQRWAQRAEPVWPSPIGTLIHSDYGLWHAYRGALLFAETLLLPPVPTRRRPCDTCVDKPCLGSCPAQAFKSGAYDVARCLHHVGRASGEECRHGGCLARRACPVGRQYQYSPKQARFHMTAFLRNGNREG